MALDQIRELLVAPSSARNALDMLIEKLATRDAMNVARLAEYERLVQTYEAEVVGLIEETVTLRAELSSVRADVEELTEQHSAVKARASAEADSYEARLKTYEAELGSQVDALAALRRDLEDANAAKVRLEHELSVERRARSEEVNSLKQALKEHRARSAERENAILAKIAEQDRHLEERASYATKLEGELTSIQSRFNDEQKRFEYERQTVRLEIASLESRLSDLLSSTSWRVTSPMRRIKQLLSRTRS